MSNVTIDDVYEIASEVCETMITKFLKNLVKLVPEAEDTVGEIQEQQYQELKQLRQNRLSESRLTPRKSVDYAPDELDEGDNNDFAAIAKNKPIGTNVADWEAKNNFDDVLSNVELQADNLAAITSQSGAGE